MSHEPTHEFTDEVLRAAYGTARRQRAAAGAAARGPACPSPDVLLAAVRGEGQESARLRTLDHALGCAACRAELALLHAVSGVHGAHVELPVPAVAAGSARPHGRLVGSIGAWRRAVPFAAAATLLVAAGLAGVALRERARAGGEDVTVRAGEADVTLVSPADGERVGAAAPVAFVWRAVPGAFRYTLEVASGDGTVVLSTPTADTALAAPLRVPAGEYRWSVRAQGADRSARRSEARVLRTR